MPAKDFAFAGAGNGEISAKRGRFAVTKRSALARGERSEARLTAARLMTDYDT